MVEGEKGRAAEEAEETFDERGPGRGRSGSGGGRSPAAGLLLLPLMGGRLGGRSGKAGG